jgi:hypothetical protein
MLHLVALSMFIAAAYLLITGINYKKWEMYYYSTPIKISGKFVKEFLGETGMKYYSIFASIVIFIISILFVYLGLNSEDSAKVDSYLSKFKSKSTEQIARERAIKEGKSEFSYVSGGITITENTITEILEEDPNSSEITIDENILISSKGVDQVICSEIKNITKIPFKNIKDSKDEKKSSEVYGEAIQVSSISDSIKKEIIKCLIKNNYKENLKDNWNNQKVNINFTKSKEDNTLIISKL